MRIVFMGTPDFSVPILGALHAAGHGPEALVVVDVSADTAFGRAPGPI